MKWYKVFNSLEKAQDLIPDRKTALVKIGTQRICFSRFDQRFYATLDKCPHNGAHLNEGNVNHLGEIICPWHNFRFNLRDGRESENRCSDLKTFPIELRSDGVYLGLN